MNMFFFTKSFIHFQNELKVNDSKRVPSSFDKPIEKVYLECRADLLLRA